MEGVATGMAAYRCYYCTYSEENVTDLLHHFIDSHNDEAFSIWRKLLQESSGEELYKPTHKYQHHSSMLCLESDMSHHDDAHLASVLDLGTDTVEGFGRLRQKGALLDLNIKVGDVVFKAHKAFMAAVSGHFNTVLTEDSAPGIVTMELEGVEADDVKVVLDYLYEQRLQLTMANLSTVLHVSVHLQLETLIIRCSSFLAKHLGKDTILEILEISRIYRLEEVYQEALRFISEYWNEVKESLVKLNKEDIISLIGGQFCCDSEADLFTIAKSWVEASPQNMGCVGEIMCGIKFPLMSENELDEIENSTPFLKTEPCCSLIEEARAYQKLPTHAKVLVNNKRSKVRGIPRSVVLSTGYSSSVGANDFVVPYVLDISPSLNYRWVSLPSIEEPLGVASVLIINNFLVACGVGRFLSEGDDVKSDCAIFDPRSYSWFPMTSMKSARVDFPLVAVGQALYALGGSTKWRVTDPISAAEVFSFKNNTWSPIKDMPDKVTNHAACETGGKVYVCGGIRADKSVSSDMWMYDPATNEWSDLPKMLTPEQGHSLLPLVQGQLFVISCESGKISNLMLNNNQWSEFSGEQIQPLPTNIAVCQFTPQLSMVSWIKDGATVRDENEAAAGDSEQAHATEEFEQAVQFASAGKFKSPWLMRCIWDFPEGVHWRHCTTITMPWNVLCKGTLHQHEERENVVLQLLRNISIA